MKVKYIVIFILCASKKEALFLGNNLLKKRLIACVNILGNIESRFWWNSKLDRASEVMMVCKTTVKNFNAIKKFVRGEHSYKVPEILALPILYGDDDYLGWIKDNII